MKTKIFNKLLTLTLIISALSVVQTAWALEETIDFSSSCWGISYQNYVNGTFYDHGYTIDGYQLKYNTYVDAVMLNYLGSSDRIGYGTITLPTFSGTISAIKVYTVNATSSTLRYIDLYVNGVLQGTTKTHSVQPDATHYTTPASWTGLSIAPGSTVMLKNVTNSNEVHIGSIEITHSGKTSLFQSTSIDGKGNVSATVTPVGAGTVSISPTRQNVFEDVEVEAIPASGYEFSYWEAYVYTDCSSESLDNSILYMGTEEAENLVTIPYGGYDAGLGNSYGKNVRLVAHFEEVSTYTVSYNRSKASCAQNGSGSWFANATGITSGTVHSLPTDIELDGVDGYTFAGWTTNGTYSNSSTAPSPLYTTSVTVTSNLTLYPVFQKGGTTGPSVSFSRKKSTAMEAGYYLIAIGQSGSQPCVGPNLNTTTYKLDPISQTVTASSASVTDRQVMWQVAASGTYWTIKNVYTNQYIALRRSGGDIANNKIDLVSSVTNDAKWTVIIKGEHYYFQSAVDANYYLSYRSGAWYAHDFTGKDDNTINNYSGSIYLYKSSTTPAAATSTYTINPECNTHTLTYNANGATSGAVPASATEYTSGSSVTVKGNSGDLAKTGYDFNGWKTAPSSGTAYAAGSTITMSADYTLYAQWLAHTIDITLDANTAAGGLTDGSASVKYDGTALESETTHVTGSAGKTLLGYYAAADGSTKVLNADGSFAAASVAGYITSSKWIRDDATTLYAHWRDNTYQVSFNMNATGPTGTMTNQNFTYGVAQDLKTNAFKWTAHNFEGWATTPSGAVVYGNKANVINLTATDGATVPLYAVWTDKTYNDYKFTCVDIALTTEDTDPVLVTSRNGVNIMAKKKLILTVDGTTGVIDLASEGNVLKFYKKTTSAPIRYVELTGANRLNAPVTDQEIYVSYAPTTAGTGASVYPRITVTQGANIRNYDGKVIARNLPDAVAIVAKVGSTWYALPANMTTAANPAPVPVTVALEGGVLKATGPSTVSYKLWPVATTNSTQDRFGTATGYTPAALYADRLRFAGNYDKALWMNNSTSASTIKNDGAITAIGNHFATDAAYEWEVTTTETDGQFVYNLKANNSSNTNYLRMKEADFKWGTYASGNTNELYILPLIEKTPVVMNVIEWCTDSMVISYPNGANASAITATIGEGTPTTVTKVSLGGDIFKLKGVGDLQSNPAKMLTLDITESGSPKQMIFTIPLIVDDAKTEAVLRSSVPGANATEKNRLAATVDVVIRNGGTLTTGSASGSFKDLYIYPGGKADISRNFAVKNIYMRGGFSWSDNKATFLLPQMKVTDGVSITGIGSAGNGVYYDLYADFAMFYNIALPKTVTLSQVTNEENGDVFSARVKWYDGSKRSGANPMANCWVALTSGSDPLERGKGYEIAVKPRTDGATNGRTIGILRFPLLKATAWSNEGDCTPAVTAHGMTAGALNTGVTANNAGWNLMGNPFFSSFTATSAGLVIDSLTKHLDPVSGTWNGTYDWLPAEKVKYYTIPNKTDYDFTDARAATYKLEAFWPFFIQAASDGMLTFSASKRVLRTPALAQQHNVREINLDFMLENAQGVSDIAGLNISDDYLTEFDMDDKVKTIENGIDFMKVYTIMGGYKIAFNSMPEIRAAQSIPVGYIAPKAGDYIFTLPSYTDFTDIEAILLTDYQEGITTDLIFSDYEFSTAKGQFDERFVLNIILRAPQVATDIDDVQSSGLPDVRVMGSNGQIIIGGLPQGADVYIYDMTGKMITHQASAGPRLGIAVPHGVYNVRILSNDGNLTIKTIVKD